MAKVAGLVLLLAAMLTGCSTPIPVNNSPTFTCYERNEQGFIAYDKDGNKRTTNCDPPIADMADLKAVVKHYEGYYQTYIMEAQEKREAGQNANEVSFYGAILGVLGGMADSPAAAIAGGTIAAGGQLMSERYRHQVQAANYELAADAMLCMYMAAKDIGDEFSVKTREPAKTYIMFGKNSDVALRDIGRDGLIRVRDKLYRLQSRFELGRPDPNLLKQSLTDKPEEPKKQDPSKANQLHGIFSTFAAKAEEDTPSAHAAADFKNKINECYSKIGG